MTNEDLQQIQNLVTGAHKVLVVTHRDPSVDTMASVLALYLALSKMGKDVSAAIESDPLVEVSNLVGIDQVKTVLGGKNLLMTYKPYALGDFEKVSYLEDPGVNNPADDSFKLTITPRDGFTPDPRNFTFSTTGASNFDLVFTIDLLEPTMAGNLYDPQLFASPIINIDNHDPNKDYGKFNLVEPDAASISEIVTFFLRAISAQMDADIAGNLYQGIVQASNNFQSPKVAAATFEAAAICLRSGAKAQSVQQQAQTITMPVNNPVNPQNQPRPQSQPQPRNFAPQQQNQQRMPNQPKPQNFQQGQNAPQQQNQPPQQGPVGGAGNVPTDWNSPKAYRGTSVV